MSCRRSRCLPFVAALALAAGASACGAPPPMSAADRVFDEALSKALSAGPPVAMTSLEPGGWEMVCVVGESRPSAMMPGQVARPGEEAFQTLFDAAAYWRGPSSAFAFLYSDGVEVRPVSGLHVNMGRPINRCVPEAQAILVRDREGEWRFRDFAGGR